jgi:DNA-binding CsgD family transcriptional regulator
VRRALDRQAAFVLLAAGALPVEVAMQLAASAEPGDEAAISTLFKAAEMLGPTDPGAAADLSKRALELCPPKHPLRGPLVAGTTVWLHAAGHGSEGKAFADTALRQALPSEQEAAVRLSIASMISISPDVRADACREALALPNVDAKMRARLSALLFHNLMTAGRTDEARAALEEAGRAVRDCEDPGGQFVLEVAQSGLAYSEEDFDGSLNYVEAGLRTSFNADDETRAHLTRQWRCDTLMMLDRFDEALEYGTDHIVAAQRDRQAWALHIYETGRARLFLEKGKLADAAAVLEENYSVDTAHEVVSVMGAAGVVALGRVAIHRGDQPLMRQTGEIASIMVANGAPSVRRHGVWLLALLAMAIGRADRAHEWLCRHGDQERLKIVPRFPMGATDEVTLVHMAQRAEDPELAIAACERSRHRELTNPGVRSIAAVAAHTGGLLHRNPTQLAQAIELFEGGPRPLALASACEDFGIICVEDADTERGIAAFTRALGLYATSGAAWDAARLRGRLRALGVRRRLSVSQRPRSGWAALTDSELEVARLVAQSFTNREVAERLFVSHYTVSGHLRSIYNKLDINSRVELSRLVSENLKR